jgi:hypothetical protein
MELLPLFGCLAIQMQAFRGRLMTAGLQHSFILITPPPLVMKTWATIMIAGFKSWQDPEML